MNRRSLSLAAAGSLRGPLYSLQPCRRVQMMKYWTIVGAAVGVLAASSVHGQPMDRPPLLSVIPHAGAGIPIHFMGGAAVEMAAGRRLAGIVQVDGWLFRDDCVGTGPCFDTGMHADAGVNIGLRQAAAVLQPYLGAAAGMMRRRDEVEGERHHNPSLRGRLGADWRAAGAGVSWRAELGVVHLFDEPGHGTGPFAYVSLGLSVPVLMRN